MQQTPPEWSPSKGLPMSPRLQFPNISKKTTPSNDNTSYTSPLIHTFSILNKQPLIGPDVSTNRQNGIIVTTDQGPANWKPFMAVMASRASEAFLNWTKAKPCRGGEFFMHSYAHFHSLKLKFNATIRFCGCENVSFREGNRTNMEPKDRKMEQSNAKSTFEKYTQRPQKRHGKFMKPHQFGSKIAPTDQKNRRKFPPTPFFAHPKNERRFQKRGFGPTLHLLV